MSALNDRQVLFRTLHHLSDLMSGDRDLERMTAGILDAAIELFGAEAACVLLSEQNEIRRTTRRRAELGQVPAFEVETIAPRGLSARLLSQPKPIVSAQPAGEPGYEPAVDAPRDIRPRNLIAVPFGDRAGHRGALLVLNGLRFEEEPGEMLDILSVLGGQMAVAVENMRLYRRLEQLAITDELTQVYNYRFLKAALRKEVKRAGRFGEIFSILMIDVDNLKQYNERNGHLRGSELLRTVGGLLLRNSRSADLVAKYGGDEFMIILPRTETEGAQVMAERIRAAVEKQPFTNARPGDITISIGISTFPMHGPSVRDLVACADEALFEAKRGGRNCVRQAPLPAAA